MKAKLFLSFCTLSLTLACSDAPELNSPLPGASGGASAGAGGGFTTAGGSSSSAGSSAFSGATTGGAFGGGGGAPLAGGGAGGGAGAFGSGGQGGAAAGSGGAGGAAPSEGQALYDANCKMCHAQEGAGSPLAPEIQHPVRDYATWVVRNGRSQTTYMKPMEKYGTDKLSDAQLGLILDYLALPPKPMGGAALYADYCANCHGADAKGGPAMRPLLNEVDKVEDLVRSGKSIGQYQMRHDSMPKFSTSMISDGELIMIRDYIDSL